MPKSIPTNSERNSSLSATSHRQLRGTNDLQEGAKINYHLPQKENNNNKSSPPWSGEDRYKRKTPDPSSRAPLSPRHSKRQKHDDDDDYHLRVDEGTAKNNDIGSSGRIGTTTPWAGSQVELADDDRKPAAKPDPAVHTKQGDFDLPNEEAEDEEDVVKALIQLIRSGGVGVGDIGMFYSIIVQHCITTHCLTNCQMLSWPM